MSNSDAQIAGLVTILSIGVYLLPSIIAFRKKKKNKWAICLTNIVFGWTLIGWLITLIWSVMND